MIATDKVLLLAAVMLAPMTATAELSYYMGAGAGGTRVEEDLDITFTASVFLGDPSSPVLTPVASQRLDKFNGTDMGFRVFGGVRLGRFLGIEGGYVDLGEPEDEVELNVPSLNPSTGEPVPPGVPGTVETDYALVLTDEIDGWEVYALAAVPFAERWEAFAKLGMIAWDSDFVIRNDYTDFFTPTPPGTFDLPVVTPPSSSQSDDGVDLAGGLGVNYKATDHMTLRGEGTWYDIDNIEQAWMLGFDVIYEF